MSASLQANTPPQVGGGASEAQRSIKTLNDSVLLHLTKIFQTHASKDDGVWHHDHITAFLQTTQADPGALDDLPGEVAIADRNDLDRQGFLDYMTSPASAATAPPRDQDLSWPLHSYFISSSHNTYLTGNQLSSESSVDAYKNVLLRGCRCIEIDVWDGDDDSDADSVSSISSDEAGTADKKESRFRRLKNKLPNPLGKGLRRMSPNAQPVSHARPTHSHPGSPSSTRLDKVLTPPRTAIIEPRVLHGYTLTKDVSFRDVCTTVRDYGFKTTDTPLIVSLEVHCNAQQQSIMVDIMQGTWKDLLVAMPDADPAELPRPADLKGKILVKVKYAPPKGSPGGSPTGDAGAGELTDEDDRLPNDAQKSKPSKITQGLSRLGIYTRGVTFKSLTQPEASMPTHIFSLAEKKVIDVHEKSAKALFDHNMNFMMRAYPSGLRIRSSNLDPAPFWRKGIQVVALNWQRWDEGMMLNEGMFAGTHGYVLKPEGYRGKKSIAPATDGTVAPVAKITRKTLDLRVEVLAAQNLPLPPDDEDPKGFKPYVKVELHVEGPDERISDEGQEKEGEYKARTKTARGRHPDFQGEVLKFSGIPQVVDQLAFVRFTVRDDEFGRDDLAAWACIRLDRLRSGYRFVHLNDCSGHLTDGAVLVRITKVLK